MSVIVETDLHGCRRPGGILMLLLNQHNKCCRTFLQSTDMMKLYDQKLCFFQFSVLCCENAVKVSLELTTETTWFGLEEIMFRFKIQGFGWKIASVLFCLICTIETLICLQKHTVAVFY